MEDVESVTASYPQSSGIKEVKKMSIQEATKLAMEKGVAIRRNNQNAYGILPTNLVNYQCLIVTKNYKTKGQTAYARWQPSADDLIADDWVLEN